MSPAAADDPRDNAVPGAKYLTTEELRRDVSALREILQARLDGMDRATVVLSDTVNRTPTAIQIAVGNLRELLDEKLVSQGATAVERFRSISQQLDDRVVTYDEKFASIQLQFSERDVRTDQAATASASALAAALQAAKEAVFEQAQAAAKAAEKTELSFTKQIDQIQLQIKTIGDGFSDRIAELKERIDRGEGTSEGTTMQRDSQRLNTGQILQTFALLAAVIGLIITLVVRK